MSGVLPKTGIGVVTIGGVAGGFSLPLPLALAAAAAAMVTVGAVLVRASFRRRRPVGVR